MKKSRFILLVVLLLTICASCVALSACGNKTDDTNKNRTTITYYLYEDSAPVTSVVYDGNFSLSILPTKAHCTFLGLFDDKTGGTKIVDENGRCNVVIDRSMTLWAQWQRKECTITFDAGDGTLAEDLQSMKVIYESSISVVPVPEYEGYDFVGWVSGSTLVSSRDTILSGKTAFTEANYLFADKSDNVILTAQYTRKVCKVTLDFNDGSYQTEEASVYYGDTLESITFPEKDNGKSIIVEWSAESNRYVAFTGTVKSNITLYAIWKDYKAFKFYVDDENYNEHKVLRDEEYVIPDPERNGYEFDGWYNSATFSGNPIERVAYGSAITAYYAKWNPIEYEISFVTNGGDALLSKAMYTIEDEVNLPQAGAKQYCVFVGWCKNENLSDTPITSISKGTYGNLTLYAKWHGEDRTVILDAGEGRITNSNRIVEYGASFNLGVPTLDGYEFQGWYTASNEQLTDKTGCGLSEWTIADETTTLHAEYLKKYYVSITYSHENAGTVNIEEYYIAGNQVTLSINLIDNGFNIVGFYSNAQLVASGENYEFVMPESNVALRVVFDPREINVTLNSDGGYLNTNSVLIEYLDTFSLPVSFKQGYIFDGWSYDGKKITDSNGNGLSPWNIKNNVTLKATYVNDPDAANKTLVFDTTTLLAIANAPAKTYVVVSDIDMAGISWTPFAFSGILNGNGFTIKNLSISLNSGNIGMFSSVSGTISDLSFENLQVTSTSYNDVYVGGLCAELTGTLSRITIKSGNIKGEAGRVGGIVGYNANGKINNCSNYATVEGASQLNSGSVGGIVGYLTNNGSIADCENYGYIIGYYQTGGIIGQTDKFNFSNLTNHSEISGKTYTGGVIGNITFSGNVTLNVVLVNHGKVVGENNVGGVIGRAYESVDSSNSYTVAISRMSNDGKVEGKQNVGGIIGYLYVNNSYGYSRTLTLNATGLTNLADITGVNYVGGIFGYAHSNSLNSKMSDCSSGGTITAEAYIGGLAGYLQSIQLERCSNDSTYIIATGYIIDGTSYYAYVGGYAGYGYSAVDCINNIDISYTESGSYIGGIIGYSNGTFSGCTNNGNISATRANYVGGIAGYVRHTGNATHSALNNSGNVTGADCVGGVFGRIYESVDSSTNYVITANRATNSGEIKGHNYIGGVVGYFYANNTYGYSRTSTITVTMLTNTANVTGIDYVGGLVGYVYSNSTSSKISGSNSSATITAEACIGGLVGYSRYVQLEDCSNQDTEIIATGYMIDGTSYYAYVGGYAGYGYSITNCINATSITYSSMGNFVGGVAGYSNGSITGCSNSGTITVTQASYVGGLVGYVVNSGSVAHSSLTNSGQITGNDNVGGIFGRLYQSVDSSDSYTITINRVTNSGIIKGRNYVGGIAGYSYANNSYGYSRTSTIIGTVFSNTANVTGNNYVGGLLGYAYTNSTNSKLSGSNSSGTITAEAYIGGIAGYLRYVQLEECSNADTNIVASGYVIESSTNYAYVGGYVGYGYSIASCNNTSDITYSSVGGYIGGIAGYVTGAISNCENKGNVTAKRSAYVGGLIGGANLTGSATLSNLTNEGKVVGSTYVGGIFGRIYQNVDSSTSYTITANRLTNNGNVEGGDYVGGIVGYFYIKNTYGYSRTSTFVASLINNTADIKGASYVGGLFGYVYTNSSTSFLSADYVMTGKVVGTGSNVSELVGSSTNFTVNS